MALSLLPDTQTVKGLAAVQALVNMKHETESNPMNGSHQHQSTTLSPTDPSSMYAELFRGASAAAAGQAMGMLTPQMLAVNQTAAALMAARIPLSAQQLLATTNSYFAQYPSIFNSWPHHHGPVSPRSSTTNSIGMGHHQTNTFNNSATSPPMSPISPKTAKRIASNNNYNNNNNNIVSTTTSDLMLPSNGKRGSKRKTTSSISVKKELLSPPLLPSNLHTPDTPSTTHVMKREMMSPGPISPPTSGSSPQSNGSIDNGPPNSHLLPGNNPISLKDPSRDKVFTCKICSRSFGYKHVLQNHERTHTGEKPFECAECHKRFTRDHHLKTHMRLHTGEKPYHCSHCDRQFVQVANLRRHLRVHTGERPYTCEICKAKFSDSNQLKAHMLIHNGEKPFGCDSCHVRFRRSHHLLHHKCGTTNSLSSGLLSPPTPAISPAISSMSGDHKSGDSSQSEISDGSLDLSGNNSKHDKSLGILSDYGLRHHAGEEALDLSSPDEFHTDLDKRSHRKSLDVRRILRIPEQIIHIKTALPEQTEPEDLSMHSPRSNISNDDDLEDLDDAASLYVKQQTMGVKHFLPLPHL